VLPGEVLVPFPVASQLSFPSFFSRPFFIVFRLTARVFFGALQSAAIAHKYMIDILPQFDLFGSPGPLSFSYLLSPNPQKIRSSPSLRRKDGGPNPFLVVLPFPLSVSFSWFSSQQDSPQKFSHTRRLRAPRLTAIAASICSFLPSLTLVTSRMRLISE